MLVVLQVQCVSQIAFSEHYASMPDTITSIKHIKIFDPVAVDQTQDQTSSDDFDSVIANLVLLQSGTATRLVQYLYTLSLCCFFKNELC